MQWAEKSYSIDSVVVSCHINIPNKCYFKLLKILNE